MSPFWLRFIGLAIVAAALMGIGAGLTAKHYRPIVAKLEKDLDDLAQKVTAQNDAIEALAEAGTKRADEAKKALAAADAKRRQAETHAQSLLARQLKPGEDACTAASDLIREELAP